MNLMQFINTDVWMIEDETLHSLLPSILQLLKGEQVTFGQLKVMEPYAIAEGSDYHYTNYDEVPTLGVAIYPVLGIISRYDQEGGPEGTESLMARMKAADTSSNIGAHFLYIDTPGGDATNMETVARTIRGLNKPVVAFFTGRCCSGGYYIACAADVIFGSQQTDRVGSIGVKTTRSDLAVMYEKMGIKIEHIYADQSTLKDEEGKAAEQGDFSLIKTNFLNPFADVFTNTVKEFRPSITDEAAFKGRVYMVDKAISIGMIDGQKTYEEALVKAFELSHIYSQNQNQKEENMDMNTSIPKMNSVLDTTLEMKDGGVFLNAEQLSAIEAALVTENEEAIPKSTLTQISTQLAEMNTKLAGVQTEVQAVKTTAATNTAALENNKAAVEALGAAPGAKPTVVPAAADVEPAAVEKNPDADALEKFNQDMAANAKTGGSLVS